MDADALEAPAGGGALTGDATLVGSDVGFTFWLFGLEAD